MEQKNGPTTGEIVRELRAWGEDRHTNVFIAELCDSAADRLESQERTIAALTVRAEQAEAREGAMIDYLRGYCQFCEHDDCMEEEPPCCDCENVTHDGREYKWELRGLPQEGEGKQNG